MSLFEAVALVVLALPLLQILARVFSIVGIGGVLFLLLACVLIGVSGGKKDEVRK